MRTSTAPTTNGTRSAISDPARFTRHRIAAAGAAVAVLLASGCSAAAERATEFGDEQTLDATTDAGVVVDLDIDAGAFSVETEEAR